MAAEPLSREDLWQHQFSEVDREIAQMASLCGIDILDRAQLRRALENDAGACTHSNALAFEKLHTLLKAHYVLRDRAAGIIGEKATQVAIDEAVAVLLRRFAAARAGQAPQ